MAKLVVERGVRLQEMGCTEARAAAMNDVQAVWETFSGGQAQKLKMFGQCVRGVLHKLDFGVDVPAKNWAIPYNKSYVN